MDSKEVGSEGMNQPLTPAAYRELVWGDIEWLDTMPRSLERGHIRLILEHQIRDAEEICEKRRLNFRGLAKKSDLKEAALRLVRECPGIRVSELAEALDIDGPVAFDLVDELHESGDLGHEP